MECFSCRKAVVGADYVLKWQLQSRWLQGPMIHVDVSLRLLYVFLSYLVYKPGLHVEVVSPTTFSCLCYWL